MVRALWTLTWCLVALGVTAAALRVIFPTDLAFRAEPIREFVYQLTGVHDPFAAERSAELARFEVRYEQHPELALMHVVAGGVFLLLAPLQFLPEVRNRYRSFHRWSGRALLVMAILLAIPAFFFGELMPFGGVWEARAIAIFGIAFLVSLAIAWVAIRNGQRDRHREWMIRAFSLAIAIATVRVVSLTLDLPLTVSGVRPAQLFALGIWIGWSLSLGAAELWIRRTRVTA